MPVRKKELWKVPAFCAAAGIASFYLIVYLLGRFAVVRLPGNVVSIDQTRQLMVYGVVFAAALLIGGLVLFRGMTRAEIFLSASVMVAFGLLLTLAQWLIGGGDGVTGPAGLAFAYLSQLSEWSRFLSQLAYRATGSPWAAAVANDLAPYIFVLFGQRGSGGS